MYGLLAGLLEQFLGTPAYNICILGAEQTGKTLLFSTIKYIHQYSLVQEGERNTTYKATVGLNAKYKNGDDKFKVWDLGGRSNLRKIWESYYSQCHGIIFVIDDRYHQALQILKNVLTHQQMAKIPLVIIATVQNVKERIEEEIKQVEGLQDRKFMVHELLRLNITSSKAIVKDLLHWLYFSIRQLHNSLKE